MEPPRQAALSGYSRSVTVTPILCCAEDYVRWVDSTFDEDCRKGY